METEAEFSVYQNQLSTVMNRYTSTNTNGVLPRYNQYNQNNLKISDRFIEDGSYLRIQNISLGYNLPEKIINKAKISSFRIYVSGQNLHTFTKYDGYDPELGAYNNNVILQNIDYGHYPNPRSFTVGANIVF
jgi:TonB-dependent starch-binding outer membrane protein SusC